MRSTSVRADKSAPCSFAPHLSGLARVARAAQQHDIRWIEQLATVTQLDDVVAEQAGLGVVQPDMRGVFAATASDPDDPSNEGPPFAAVVDGIGRLGWRRDATAV